jgi:hypothetical protein
VTDCAFAHLLIVIGAQIVSTGEIKVDEGHNSAVSLSSVATRS